MKHLASALAFLGLAAFVPAQVAVYDFLQADMRSSDSDPNSVAGDLVASEPIMFYTRDGYSNLCLGTDWTNGGTLSFDVQAASGYALSPTSLVLRSSNLQPSTTVLVAVQLRVNGTYIGRSTIIANPSTTKTFTLTGFPALEGQSNLHVELLVEGRNDSDMYEFDSIVMDCTSSRTTRINPQVDPISSCDANCFTIGGERLTNIDRVEIDGIEAGVAGWSYSITNSTSMSVCPPASRTPGNYDFEAFVGNASAGTATLTIAQGGPVLGIVRNPSLPVVTADCFEIEGCGLPQIDRVRFDADTLSQSGLLGDGRWHLVSDSLIEVCPPQCLPAGSYRICFYRGSTQIGCRTVNLSEPTTPTLACDERFPVGSLQCIYIHDGGTRRPNLVFGVVSADPRPSIMPGLIQLGLGGGFTNYFCGIGVPGPCVEYCIGTIPSVLAGRTLYFQGAILVPDGSVLPIPVTNVCSSTYF